MQILPNYLFFKIFMQSAILQYSLQTKQTEKILYRKKTQSILPPRGKNCVQKKMSSPQFCRLNFTKFIKVKLLNNSFI